MATYYLDFEGGADYTEDVSPAWGPYRMLTTSASFQLVSPAVIDNTHVKFGNYALNTTSTTAARLCIATPCDAGLQPGAGQFTIEAWCWWNSTSATANEAICGNTGGASNNGCGIIKNSSGNLAFNYSTTGSDSLNVAAAYTPTTGAWTHIAVDRDASNVVRVYANGVVIASATVASTIFAGTGNFYAGNDSSQAHGFPGWIGGFRFTKGVARYAGAFTPPTAAFPTSSATDTYWSSVTCLLPFNMNGSGTSFANRWRTLTYGAASTRVAAGDTVRVMSSKDPTSLGQTATWTNNSNVVTLSSAVNLLIDDCETAWTASTNVTATTTTTRRSGSNAANLAVAAAFTTGLAAYKALGSAVDFSAYQQVCFWFKVSAVTGHGLMSLRLCSDTAGAVTVNTITIPAVAASSSWTPVVVDTGAALGSSIQSVALYFESDYSTSSSLTVNIDNINACKASSAADSITLNSLIGKVSQMPWQASTAYSLNDIRIPTTPNRNGWAFQVTTAGTTGATEPTWPDYPGATVTDGTVVWTAYDNEDGWYPVGIINGTSLTLDSDALNLTTPPSRKYPGVTETILTYKREPSVCPQLANSTVQNQIQRGSSGSTASTLYSGGWDRTSMGSQTGESIISLMGSGVGFSNGSSNAGGFTLQALGVVRSTTGFILAGSSTTPSTWVFQGCRALHSGSAGMNFNTSIVPYGFVKFVGCQFYNHSGNTNPGITFSNQAARFEFKNCNLDSSAYMGIGTTGTDSAGRANVRLEHCNIRCNGNYGVYTSGSAIPFMTLLNCFIANSGSYDLSDDQGIVKMTNTSYTTVQKTLAFPNATLVSKKNGVAGSHFMTSAYFTVASDSSTVNTPGGLSWKITCINTTTNQYFPVVVPIAQIFVKAGVTKNISIYCRRSSTNIQGQLRIRGGQLLGVPEQTVSLAPTINAWVQSSAISFTPTEDGVLEVEVLAWDGVGTTNNLWVDDLTVV